MNLDDVQRLPSNTQFTIDTPNSHKSLFSIRSRQGSHGKWTPFPLVEVDAANRLFDEGRVDYETTYKKLKGIRAALYAKRIKERQHDYSDHNMDILEKYWATKYPASRRETMKAPEKSREDLERAISAVGALALDTCSQQAIVEKLFEEFSARPTVLRKRAMWINSLLVFLGKSKLVLGKRKRARLEVTYLNETEFFEMLRRVEDPIYRMIMRIGFYTGLRIGEIFGLTPKNVRADHIHVTQQMYSRSRGYRITSTKTDDERDAVLVPAVKNDVQAFAALPTAEKRALRDVEYCKIITKICLHYWPDDPEKYLNFHALRHSNAIWLLQKGATLHEVAQHLGNGLEVTERYYAGFVLKKESIERLQKIVGL